MTIPTTFDDWLEVEDGDDNDTDYLELYDAYTGAIDEIIDLINNDIKEGIAESGLEYAKGLLIILEGMKE